LGLHRLALNFGFASVAVPSVVEAVLSASLWLPVPSHPKSDHSWPTHAMIYGVIEVPTAVRNKALAAGAEWWLAALPELLEMLQTEWDIRLGKPFVDGTEAYVIRAETLDGGRAVLKLLLPRDDEAARNEITVLRLADGVGCPELYRHDASRGAILMERLGPSLFELGLPVTDRQNILCDAATQLWRPAPDCGLPTGAQKGNWLVEYVTKMWDELDRPCSSRAIDYSVECAQRRIAAHRDERAVVVHGDIHQWNALQVADGFKLVDPDGLLAEPEYDLGIIMREDPLELVASGDPQRRARRLADRTGLDATAIWEWGAIERVSTGLLATKIELQPVGRHMLEVADQVAI